MQVQGKTDPGRVRDENQDVFALREDLGLAVLADGMGGARAGGVAAEIAVDAALEHLTGVLKREPVAASHLQTALQLANTRVVGMSNAISAYRGMGTTLVAMAINGPKACICHVGDSRAYRLHDGTLTQITKDHSLVQEWVDAGAISPEEARHAPNRNIITRAIGAQRSLKADVTELEVVPDDRLLLCSDGLTGMLEDHEIAHALQAEDDLGKVVGDLVEAANRAGGRDNVTVVLIQC